MEIFHHFVQMYSKSSAADLLMRERVNLPELYYIVIDNLDRPRSDFTKAWVDLGPNWL